MRLGSKVPSASGNNCRGGATYSTTASVRVRAMPLPARMVNGTPAHLHESISNRREQ